MTIETRDIRDRSHWASGPWDDEPDRIEWRIGDLVALALRSHMGMWCGYVGVPPGHPWHGQEYGAIDPDVHGGLSYTGACMDHGDDPPESVVCHAANDGEPDDVWWVGFDCGHFMDRVPLSEYFDHKHGFEIQRLNTYRDRRYVVAEIESLAEQAQAAA